MGITQTEIANRALIKLGKNPVTNIDDKDDEAASLIKQSWDILRDSELRNHAWLFAIARAKLPALADAPAFGYSHAYQVPSDFIRLVTVNGEYASYDPSVYNAGDGSRWQLEGRQLLSNDPAPLLLRYVRRVENISQWDASFIDLFSCRLAAELSNKVSGSGSDRQLAWSEYDAARRMAYKNNAIEMDVQVYPDTYSIGARVH